MGSFETMTVRFASGNAFVVEHRCTAAYPSVVEESTIELPTLGFVLTGLGIIEANRTRLFADPNQIVVFPPGVRYGVRHRGCRRGACALTVQASLGLLGGPAPAPEWWPERPLLLPRPRPVILALHRLWRVLDQTSWPGESSEVEELVLHLVDLCLCSDGPFQLASEAEAFRGSHLVERTKEILLSRMREPIRLPELAAEVGCTGFYLCRLFRRETGTTLSRYLHRLRLNEALRRFGEGTGGNLSDLALDLGFASHSHFTAVFRRELGRLPSKLRADSDPSS